MDDILSSRLLFACFFYTLLILQGCHNPTPEDMISEAVQHHTQGNTEAAILELRMLLKEHPDSYQAVLALNKIYAGRRQYDEIINLLFPRIKSGWPNQGALYSLTDALIQSARFKEACRLVKDNESRFKSATGLALHGHCLSGLNRTDEAELLYKAALRLDENLISAHLGIAQEAILKAEKQSSDDYDANELPDENAWVASRHEKRQNNNPYLEKARSHLHKVLEIEPDNTAGNYLSAVTFYLENDIENSQAYINKVLEKDPNHRESLLLMGKLHLELAHLDKSKQFLERYIKIVPDDLKARLYLASIMLRKHQPDLAIELLKNFEEQGANDPEYLLVAGNAYLALEKHDLAIDYFEKARAIYPSSELVKMYSAMGYLARSDRNKNDQQHAIYLLEEVLEYDPENSQAGIALVTTLMYEGQLQHAEKVVAHMINQFPEASIPWYLSAMIAQQRGDKSRAISDFRKSIEFNHTFLPSILRLAKLYEEQSNYIDAEKVYQAAMYDLPYNPQIMTELALLEQKRGNNNKTLELLELARDRNRQALTPRLLLGSYYLKKGRIEEAKKILKELQSIAPDRIEIRRFTGQFQLATGRAGEAARTFSMLVQRSPHAPEILTDYARALRMSGKLSESKKVIKTALSLSENPLLETLLEVSRIEMATGNLLEVNKVIERLKANFPDSIDYLVLEGDMAMMQRAFETAASFYEKALLHENSPAIVLKLVKAYERAGFEDRLISLLEDEIKNNPDDLRFSISLAQYEQQRGNSKKAAMIYEHLLDRFPENSLLLNDLAWLYEKDTKRALSFAERAYRLAPELSAIMDTYGWFCIKAGRLREGKDLLERAVKKSPLDPEYRYHLAEALVMDGDEPGAIHQLEKALADKTSFNGRARAEELMVKLSKGSLAKAGL